MCHYAKLSQNQKKMRLCKETDVRCLEFSNFLIFVRPSGWEGNMHHHTKFHQNRSNNCSDITFNVFQNGSLGFFKN